MSIARIALPVAAAALLALTGNSTAEAGKPLRWKFQAGDELRYLVQQESLTAITNSGLDFDVELQQSVNTVWTVQSVDDDGTADLTMKVERIRMSMNSPFSGEFSYDSDSEETGEGQLWEMVAPLFQAAMSGEFQARITPAGEALEIALPEQLAEILEAQQEAAIQNLMMGGGITEQTFHEMIGWTFFRVPGDDVEPQAKWSWAQEVLMEPIGSQELTSNFHYVGSESRDGRELEQIGVEVAMEFLATEGGEPDLYLEFTEHETKGSTLFDAARGRAVETTLTQTLSLEGDFRGNEFFQDRNVKTTFTLEDAK